MELNSIKIPEGYHAEIDNENGVINIVKNEEPKHQPAQSWSAYCAKTKHDGLYWVQENGVIQRYGGGFLGSCLDPEEDKLTFTSREKAEAVVALCQLMLLHEDWVGDWKPKLVEGEIDMYYELYTIRNNNSNEIFIPVTDYKNGCLNFPTHELAEKFKNQFIDLLEKAKYLL